MTRPRRGPMGKAGRAVLVLLAGVALLVLVGASGHRSSARDNRVTGSAVVLAGQAGDLAVGLRVSPAPRHSVRVRATVLGPDGRLGGLRVAVLTGDRSHAATPCGTGCYRTTVPIGATPPRLAVAISGPGRPRRTARFEQPGAWPAPGAAAIVRRATLAFGRLRTLTDVSHLATDPEHAVTTIWRFQAPDRLSYRNLHGGPEAIIVGGWRWDRLSPDSPWQRSAQEPVHQPEAPWPARISLAHLVGTVSINGTPAWRISFVDAAGPAWYTIDVARGSYRTLRVDMIAAAHFMHDRYTGFDAPLRIVPPATRQAGR